MTEVRNIQNIQLDILKEFEQICSKYNLTYFAIGGTCIGAIRHKGFIPWDDDIDVVMPFSDYCKFINLSKDVLASKYELIEGNTTEHFIFNFAKIHDSTTTYIEKSVESYKDRYCGIFLDVFPLHNLPNNKHWMRVVAYINHVLNRMNIHARFPISECLTIRRKAIHLFAIPFKLFGGYAVFSNMQNKLFKKYDKKKYSKYVIFPWRGRQRKNTLFSYKDVFYGKDFSSMEKVPFEDITISVPNGYDRYLKMDFGDYMKLPPESKRAPGHSSSVILIDKSYKDYMKRGM